MFTLVLLANLNRKTKRLFFRMDGNSNITKRNLDFTKITAKHKIRDKKNVLTSQKMHDGDCKRGLESKKWTCKNKFQLTNCRRKERHVGKIKELVLDNSETGGHQIRAESRFGRKRPSAASLFQ